MCLITSTLSRNDSLNNKWQRNTCKQYGSNLPLQGHKRPDSFSPTAMALRDTWIHPVSITTGSQGLETVVSCVKGAFWMSYHRECMWTNSYTHSYIDICYTMHTQNEIKCPPGCLSSGYNWIKRPLECLSCGLNVTKCPLRCTFSGHNMIRWPLDCDPGCFFCV